MGPPQMSSSSSDVTWNTRIIKTTTTTPKTNVRKGKTERHFQQLLDRCQKAERLVQEEKAKNVETLQWLLQEQTRNHDLMEKVEMLESHRIPTLHTVHGNNGTAVVEEGNSLDNNQTEHFENGEDSFASQIIAWRKATITQWEENPSSLCVETLLTTMPVPVPSTKSVHEKYNEMHRNYTELKKLCMHQFNREKQLHHAVVRLTPHYFVIK